DLRGAGAGFDLGIPRDLSFRLQDGSGVQSQIPAAASASTEHAGGMRRQGARDASEQGHASNAVGEDGDETGKEDLPPSAGTAVPWDRVLGVEAIEEQVRVLDRLPSVHAYQAGRSAQGRPAYALEITVPRRDGWWSRAKLSAWKCTLLLNARHHANEPSSTSALLRLAELLAHDPDWQRYLKRVNVILMPGENVDGMALYQELQDEHPTWMHHAARYNGAGMEYTSQYANAHTRHTEALVMPALWRRWAPDIYCDDHGFPAHAWVQPFAGHGNPWFRDYWIAQALIYAYLPCVTNDRYPRHREAADELQRRMVETLAADRQIAPWNERHADRYYTYLNRWLPEQFPAPYERGVLIHRSEYDPDQSARRPGGPSGVPGHFPSVTTASITTEVADETAQGSYMALCAHAHLLLDRVLLDYLYDANAPAAIQRRQLRLPDGRLLLQATRARPVIPPG
ncbi:MAG TPA: M14 family metallopeptidase, partial [Chloroflexota bacterium]|nr:M14 family metallopeptidase [Chloroflexota bacterium]